MSTSISSNPSSTASTSIPTHTTLNCSALNINTNGSQIFPALSPPETGCAVANAVGIPPNAIWNVTQACCQAALIPYGNFNNTTHMYTDALCPFNNDTGDWSMLATSFEICMRNTEPCFPTQCFPQGFTKSANAASSLSPPWFMPGSNSISLAGVWIGMLLACSVMGQVALF